MRDAVEPKTVFRAAACAAVVALVCALALGFVIQAPEPGLSLQPSMDIRSAADFLRPSNQYPALALRFFAFDTLFVLSYVMVFVGLHATVAGRARTFATLGLGAGLAAGCFDALENAFFIIYAQSALNGVSVTEPHLPLIYVVTNLKWMGAFAALAAFGLVWPRESRLGWVISALMLLFPLLGALGVAAPELVALRGLFFLVGMPLFAWHFWKRAQA